MGLAVVAYSQIKLLGSSIDGDDLNKTIELYVNPDFPDHAKGIKSEGYYSYKESKTCWRGSYSSFNNWREKLAKIAGYKPVLVERVEGYPESAITSYLYGAFEVSEGPFHELICFSDCEGTINSEISKKLLKDFEEWDEKAKEFDQNFNLAYLGFYEVYKGWYEGLKIASQDGVLSYH